MRFIPARHPIPLCASALVLLLGCAPRPVVFAHPGSTGGSAATAPAAARAPAVVPPFGLPRAAPEEVGLSAEALARIGPQVQAFVDSGRVAGVLVAVARGGKLAYLETFGRADRETDVPLAPDAVFRIYSMTKPVTAVATMQLVEQGRLRLDDPVSRYIPAFAGVRVYAGGGAASPVTVPAERPITIQDLLAHTSGLPYGLGGSPSDTLARVFDLFRASRTVAGFADSVAHLPLAFQPGSRWGYGPGLEVLGRVIEVVAERPLDEYLDEEIVRPLGMRSTSFRLRPELRARLAVLYGTGGDRRLRPQREFRGADGSEPDARFVGGGGGLVSTAADYLRFAQMLLGGGELDGVRILRPETVELMRRNLLPPEQIPLPRFMMQAPGFGHGLGVGVQVEPATEANPTAEGTFGWSGAGGTFFWIDPRNELVGMVWTQLYFGSFGTLVPDVKRLVYSALAADVAPHPAVRQSGGADRAGSGSSSSTLTEAFPCARTADSAISPRPRSCSQPPTPPLSNPQPRRRMPPSPASWWPPRWRPSTATTWSAWSPTSRR
jgi:CubicO group peptidase (beta-lactamase class C family)